MKKLLALSAAIPWKRSIFHGMAAALLQQKGCGRKGKMDLDESLMNFVNALGVITFISIVAYHVITATPKDAEF